MEEKISEEKPYLCRQWLYQKYEKEGLTLVEIAKICGVSYPTIISHMKKFGIQRRKKWGIKRNHYSFLMPSFLWEGLKRFSRIKKKTVTGIIEEATIEYMMRRDFNPFKDN